MTFLAVSLLVLLAILSFVMLRKGANKKPGTMVSSGSSALKKTTGKPRAPRNPWRATSIVFNEKACDAVKELGGKRFLDADRNTPKLPLPDCDVTECDCKYARHEDRRDETEDRRNPNALKADLYDQPGQVSRRSRKRGRRKTDWA